MIKDSGDRTEFETGAKRDWTALLATLQSTWSEWTTRITCARPAGTCCGLLTSA